MNSRLTKFSSHFYYFALFSLLLSGCASQGANVIGSQEVPSANQVVTPVSPEMVMSIMADEEPIDLVEAPKAPSITLMNTKKLGEGIYKIYGETTPDCSKIVVNAYDIFKKSFDVYTIENYQRGDTEFEYAISEAWNNLKEGENTYIFRAYCDEDQMAEASTTVTYYRPYETSSAQETLNAIQQEIKNLDAMKSHLENLQQELKNEVSQTPDSPNTDQPTYYTSILPSSTRYYCDTDAAWKEIPKMYLRSYSTVEELLKKYPGKTLNKAC